MTNRAKPKLANRVDNAGAACSSLCVMHCVLCAAAPGVLGAIGVSMFKGLSAEWGFATAAIVLGALALWGSWKRHHNSFLALLFLAGIVGLGVGRWFEMFDLCGAGPLSATAGLLLISAHVWSQRLRPAATGCS